MTLPRRRHSHRSANRSSYSSHLLLSGRQQLRRRNAKNNSTSCCCGVAGCSPALLDVLLQTGVLCLLSAVAIAIVLVVGKSLSLLQSYLHPEVPPQFDAVAVPSRPLFANSWLLRGGGVNFYYSAFVEKSEPSPVWGMNLEVEALPTNHDGFRRRIDPSDGEAYERERAMLLRRQDEATADMTEDEAERYAPNDQLDQPRKCQRTAWRSRFYPVCNLFHELTMDRDNKDRFYDAVLQHTQVFQRYVSKGKDLAESLQGCAKLLRSFPAKLLRSFPPCFSYIPDPPIPTAGSGACPRSSPECDRPCRP
jgi:hypothetical protein